MILGLDGTEECAEDLHYHPIDSPLSHASAGKAKCKTFGQTVIVD